MKKLIALMLGVSLLTNTSTTGYSGLKQALAALFNMITILNTEYTGEPSDEIWTEDTPFSLDDCVTLTKKDGEDFVILNFSDLHFGDYDYRAFTAFGVEYNIKRLVSEVQPDLITITGDIVCTDSTVYSIGRVTDLFDSLGIPWAPVFGNHDGEGNADLNYLADIMMSSKYCLMKKGDPEMGVGNYIINIAEETSGDIVQTIYMMDTHRTHLNEKQINWFEKTSAVINEKCDSEISVFFHIPVAQYQYAYDTVWDSPERYGECNEKICCQRDENGEPYDNGFFAAAKKADVKYIFCGHEHRNNFSVEYEGIRLTYTLKVGLASGIKSGFDGGTIITLDSDGINRIIHRSMTWGSKDIVDISL